MEERTTISAGAVALPPVGPILPSHSLPITQNQIPMPRQVYFSKNKSGKKGKVFHLDQTCNGMKAFRVVEYPGAVPQDVHVCRLCLNRHKPQRPTTQSQAESGTKRSHKLHSCETKRRFVELFVHSSIPLTAANLHDHLGDINFSTAKNWMSLYVRGNLNLNARRSKKRKTEDVFYEHEVNEQAEDVATAALRAGNHDKTLNQLLVLPLHIQNDTAAAQKRFRKAVFNVFATNHWYD